MDYQEKKFSLPEMEGLSKNGIDQHLSLYGGYVKNFNAISAEMTALMPDSEKHVHAISELERRLSFEFDGMRLHEYYFSQWEGGAKTLNTSGSLAKALSEKYGSAENASHLIKNIGSMRGPGWAILYWDPVAGQFLSGFSEQQHQGHFVTLPIILALDVWEHAFILDYGAQGKGKYIDAFFRNLNWEVMEERFESAAR